MLRLVATIRLTASLFLLLCSASLWAKSAAQAAPQTARQALMEMFFSKEPGTFMKHLPAVTRATLESSGALANMKQYSLLAGQFQAQGKSFETFEAGPVLFSFADPKNGQKYEVVVDSDSLLGDQDNIELTFHTYKDNQLQKTPFMPRLVFSMKQESELWTLNDIAVTVNLSLTNPDFLKKISDGMKARAAMTSPQIGSPQIHVQAMGQSSGQNAGQIVGQTPGQISEQTSNRFGGDAGTLSSMRKILAAEITYAATYPAVGNTCTLSDLDGFGASETNEHQAMLISSGLASGRHQGYSFALSGCAGSPATSFRLTATPIGESYGRRAFCSDQSGAIRSSADGTAASCLSSGTPVQ
jgi:hypothetical protein